MLDFNVQYAAWGAHSSFGFGRLGRGGGFALNDVQIPDKALYLGYWRDGEAVKAFPFFSLHKGSRGQERFNPDFAAENPADSQRFDLFSVDDIKRDFAWCSDTFKTSELEACIYTPVLDIPGPETLRTEEGKPYVCPALILELRLDNSNSAKEMTAFFGLEGINRVMSEAQYSSLASRTGAENSKTSLRGAAFGNTWGFACLAEEGLEEYQGWDFLEGIYGSGEGRKGFHRLAWEGGLKIKLAPGQKRTLRLALATWQDGTISSGIPCTLFYSQLFSSLDEVLEFALDHAGFYIDQARKRNEVLEGSSFPPSRKFLLAQASRSYLASTEFLLTRQNEALFVVNEGEYRMINTLDLSIDQMFWELSFSPWTLALELDFSLQYSSYRDAYGLSFSHDQGQADAFAPAACSSYELPGLSDCFSFMTFEQLLNWALCALTYWVKTKDFAWLSDKRSVLKDLYRSCRSRDANGDGLMDADSDRCRGGSEITTYDSLDPSLGQARGSTYLAVKTFALYWGLSKAFEALGEAEDSKAAYAWAKTSASSIISFFDPENLYLPGILESGARYPAIPAIEGLVYPYVWFSKDAFMQEPEFSRLLEILTQHLNTILVPGLCLDSESGAWKLSSGSSNTWLSKIFLNEYVAEKLLDYTLHKEQDLAQIYAEWLQGPCADWAATDQIHSATGKDLGSRLYPRLVSLFLHLNSD